MLHSQQPIKEGYDSDSDIQQIEDNESKLDDKLYIEQKLKYYLFKSNDFGPNISKIKDIMENIP
jgi:hypothetical protein